MCNNRVLIGNWCEEQNGTFELQKNGNTDSTYQRDYRERAMPARDDRKVWQIKEKALVTG